MVSNAFYKQLGKTKKAAENELRSFFDSAQKSLPLKEPSIRQQAFLLRRSCLANGKRLRPIISAMAFRAVGGKKNFAIIPASLPLELFHNYTLIHDDIYDEDNERRGVPTNHSLLIDDFIRHHGSNSKTSLLYKNSAARFGVVAGIINGRLLQMLAFRSIYDLPISSAKKLTCINMLIRQSINENIGQSIDLTLEKSANASIKEYYSMAYYKTSCLLKTSIEWGAFLGGATKKQQSLLSSFAEELGYVFQIKDDLLDIGSDIKESKRTLPMIYALKNSSKKESRYMLNVLMSGNASRKDINAMVEVIRNKRAPEYCEKIANQKID